MAFQLSAAGGDPMNSPMGDVYSPLHLSTPSSEADASVTPSTAAAGSRSPVHRFFGTPALLSSSFAAPSSIYDTLKPDLTPQIFGMPAEASGKRGIYKVDVGAGLSLPEPPPPDESKNKMYRYDQSATLEDTLPGPGSADGPVAHASSEPPPALIEIQSTQPQWTDDWTQACALPSDTRDHAVKRLRRMREIVQAFKKTAVSDVITIVNDPSRYSLGGAGGIAGGNKYLNNNIIYKFSNESAKPAQDSLFAQSNANAMKVAAHELRALNMVLDANIFGLNVPLFAVIDYNGWRIIAEACIPIQRKITVVHGSEDQTTTVHDSSPRFASMMEELGQRFNLAKHTVYSRAVYNQCVDVFGPVDMEGHLGLDGRYYLCDLSRLFACEPVPSELYSAAGQNLFMLFRPEFTKSNPEPLCCDCYVGFHTLNHKHYNEAVQRALTRLHAECIPALASELSSKRHPLFDSEGLVKLVHGKGVNVRKLGVLRSHLAEASPGARLILSEMVIRVIKNALRHVLRVHRDADGRMQGVVYFLNEVFGNSELSSLFWREKIKVELRHKFDYWTRDAEHCAKLSLDTSRCCLFPSEDDATVDLRSLIQLYPVFDRVLATTGLIAFSEVQQLAKSGKLLGTCAEPFTVQSFAPDLKPVRSSLSVDSELCLAIFNKVAHSRKASSPPIYSALKSLGNKITSPSAAIADFASIWEQLTRRERFIAIHDTVHILRGLQDAFGGWTPFGGSTLGFAVGLCRSLQEISMALHYAERYCSLSRSSKGTVHETRALIAFGSALRSAERGCSKGDLARLQHPSAEEFNTACDWMKGFAPASFSLTFGFSDVGHRLSLEYENHRRLGTIVQFRPQCVDDDVTHWGYHVLLDSGELVWFAPDQVQSRYELFAKDVTKHCTTLQLKGVFRPFLSTSQARLVEVIGSPVFLRLVDRGVSKFAAAAAIAVTQVDTANEESVDLANAWLECSVDSPSAWSIGCRSLWQANAVDTSKYDLSTPVAHGRSLPTISQCRGGVWAPDPLGFLHSSRSDVLTRLLIWHGPSKVVMPGVVMDYVSEPNPDLHWGHFILFDNGDLRWFPPSALPRNRYTVLKQVADDWSTEVTDESLLQITIDSSGWAPTDITSQPVDDLVGIRIGVYVGSSVGGVRLGTVTEAVGIDGGTSFSVLFDDGSTEMLDTNALCPHEYFLLSDGPLMPEGPRLIRRSSANTMRSRFSADKTYKPSTDVVLSADTLDVNVTVQVHWPLRGNVVNGLIVSLEGDGDRPCVVDFVDGTRASFRSEDISKMLTLLDEVSLSAAAGGSAGGRSAPLRLPKWWKNRHSLSAAGGIEGVPVVRTSACERVVHTLLQSEFIRMCEALAGATLYPGSESDARSWISGPPSRTPRWSVPASGFDVASPEATSKSSGDDVVRCQLMDMGFPFGAINHALSLYGTRDIGTLAGILTGAVDAPVDLVVVDPDLAPDVFPLEDTPDWFVTRWVSTSIDHGNFDVESAKFSAANTWGLRRYLLAEGFDFNVAMKAAKESTTRAEALNMAHAYKAEYRDVQAESSLPTGPSMARRRALSSGAGDESATPLWEDTQQLQSSLSALHRAIELMRSSSERHPLIARTLYDMSTSLPHDNSAFEGFCVVYGTKLLVEAARLYESLYGDLSMDKARTMTALASTLSRTSPECARIILEDANRIIEANFTSDPHLRNQEFAVTIELEYLIALSDLSPESHSLRNSLETAVLAGLLLVNDKTASSGLWALGSMYLRIGDVESTIPLWCQSIHLLFRIMPITSLRVLRCMYRLLWVIGAGDDTTSTHIPGIIPVDRVFAMTVHDYQTGDYAHAAGLISGWAQAAVDIGTLQRTRSNPYRSQAWSLLNSMALYLVYRVIRGVVPHSSGSYTSMCERYSRQAQHCLSSCAALLQAASRKCAIGNRWAHASVAARLRAFASLADLSSESSASMPQKFRMLWAQAACGVLTQCQDSPRTEADVAIFEQECMQLSLGIEEHRQQVQPSGLPAEISGPLFANVALFETHFGLHVKPLLGESQPITLAGRKFDICLRMDSIHMTTTLPYNSFGCTYRYKMFEDLLQDSTLQANPGSYQSVVLVLSDGLVKVPTAFTVSCWVNIASASPYELPLAVLGYVKLIDTVNSYMHKPLVDIGAIALTLPSEFQLSQSRRDALASNQDAYTAVFEQFVQGRSMSELADASVAQVGWRSDMDNDWKLTSLNVCSFRVTLTSGAASVTYAVEMKYIPERSAFRLTAPLCEAIPGIAQPYARLYIMSRLLIETGDNSHELLCGIRIINGEILAFHEVDLRFATCHALAHVAFKFNEQVKVWRKSIDNILKGATLVEESSIVGRDECRESTWFCGQCRFENPPHYLACAQCTALIPPATTLQFGVDGHEPSNPFSDVKWRCPACPQLNILENLSCVGCKRMRNASERLQVLPITLRPEVDFAEATKTVFIPRYVSVREFVHMMGPLLSKRPSEVPDSARTAAVKSLCELLTDISNFIYVAFLGAPVLRQLWNVGNPTLASSSSSPSPLSRFSDSNRCAVVAAMCLAAWRVRLAPHFHTHVLGICCAECGNVLNDANMIVYPRVGNPFSPVMFQSLPGRLSGAPHPPETACDVYCTSCLDVLLERPGIDRRTARGKAIVVPHLSYSDMSLVMALGDAWLGTDAETFLSQVDCGVGTDLIPAPLAASMLVSVARGLRILVTRQPTMTHALMPLPLLLVFVRSALFGLTSTGSSLLPLPLPTDLLEDEDTVAAITALWPPGHTQASFHRLPVPAEEVNGSLCGSSLALLLSAPDCLLSHLLLDTLPGFALACAALVHTVGAWNQRQAMGTPEGGAHVFDSEPEHEIELLCQLIAKLMLASHVDTVPLMLKYRVVDVLFETLLRRQPDSVVCSALSLIGAVNRFPPLKERLLQLFDEAAASSRTVNVSAIFRWAQRFKSSAQDRIAVVAAQMGWMEFAKARLSRDFQSLNTLQNTLRELDAYGKHDHVDIAALRQAGAASACLNILAAKMVPGPKSVEGSPAVQVLDDGVSGFCDDEVSPCLPVPFGCRYTAAAEVLARLCDDAECRRVVLYPKNTDRLIRTVMQWVEAGPAPSLPITVRALSVCRVLAPLCWYSEAVRAVFDKHGIPRLILKTADTSKTWLTAVALWSLRAHTQLLLGLPGFCEEFTSFVTGEGHRPTFRCRPDLYQPSLRLLATLLACQPTVPVTLPPPSLLRVLAEDAVGPGYCRSAGLALAALLTLPAEVAVAGDGDYEPFDRASLRDSMQAWFGRVRGAGNSLASSTVLAVLSGEGEERDAALRVCEEAVRVCVLPEHTLSVDIMESVCVALALLVKMRRRGAGDVSSPNEPAPVLLTTSLRSTLHMLIREAISMGCLPFGVPVSLLSILTQSGPVEPTLSQDLASASWALQAKVPHPWQAVFDEDSGLYYFWNEETDEVTWQHPVEKAKLETEKLPPGWKKERDPETGEVFYWNVATDETQWEPPPGTVMTSAAPAPALVPPPQPAPAAVQQLPPARASITSLPGKRKPRAVVMGESYDKTGGDKFVLPSHPKGAASKAVITDALKAAGFLFVSLTDEDMSSVVMAMAERRLGKGETIIRQGDAGDNFYVVESGEFDIFVNGNLVASRGPGSSFGELALLYNSPRAATVVSKSGALVWALDRHTFRHVLASSREYHLDTVISALRLVPLLRPLTDEQLDKVADAVQVMSFKPGDTIIRKGDVGDAFYIIKSGKVVCTGAGTATKVMEDLTLTDGNYFGERALLMSAPRAANVIAVDQTQCMVLNRLAFTELLGPLREVLDRNLGVRVIQSVPLLRRLSPSEADRVLSMFESVTYTAGQSLLKVGQTYSTFFVVKSGTVHITKGSDAEDMAAGGYFGEQALAKDAVSDCTVTAVDTVDCFVLDRRRIEREIGLLSSLSAAGAGDASGVMSPSRPSSTAVERKGKAAQKTRPASDIRFEDLQLISVLGSGTFGRVSLVKHVPTNRPFALKAMQKAQVVAFKQQVNVINEKLVLTMIDHPFVLKLEKTFKDKTTLYMLLELVQGGELFSLLANHPEGRLPSKHSRFYAACVIAALEHMHSLDILYRDLKPENMLIDAEGYIKVVDMGFAKVVKTGRTYTLCGTPEYLAPEIVMGQGHHKGVDYWASGVLIYEMLCGYSPFADLERNDQMTICKNIVRGNILFPEYVTDPGAKDIIRLLLTKNVTSRLGCGKNGARDIHNHSWFLDFDWDACLAKRIPAPWIPTLKSPFDTSNFEHTGDDHDPMPYTDDGTGWDADF